MRKINKSKYEGFSLVEMLLTLTILAFIMLTVSIVLTTLIKVSTVASNKIRARNESEFVLELVRRTVRNTNPSDLYIFNTLDSRKFNAEEETFDDDSFSINDAYSLSLDENMVGNEIHFKPYGNMHNWVCLGYFKSTEPGETEEETRGYLLMTSSPSISNTEHKSCFGDPPYLIRLNSHYVDIKNFEIKYIKSGDISYLILFDIWAQPVDWYLAVGAPIHREVFRQGVVSTEGFIW